MTETMPSVRLTTSRPGYRRGGVMIGGKDAPTVIGPDDVTPAQFAKILADPNIEIAVGWPDGAWDRVTAEQRADMLAQIELVQSIVTDGAASIAAVGEALRDGTLSVDDDVKSAMLGGMSGTLIIDEAADFVASSLYAPVADLVTEPIAPPALAAGLKTGGGDLSATRTEPVPAKPRSAKKPKATQSSPPKSPPSAGPDTSG